jgi:Zn-dependent protease
MSFDPRTFVVSLIVIVLSITLHEFGHAISADRLGDDTPRRQGRITLWPDKHFDLMGLIFMVMVLLTGHGLGWGKPVQVDFRKLRNPRRDMLIVAACGPLMNLLIACVAAMILRIAIMTHNENWLFSDIAGNGLSLGGEFIFRFLSINLSLMFFNLIPVHPLDGSKILTSLLPRQQVPAYERTVGVYGPPVLLAVCIIWPSSLWIILGPPVTAVGRLLVGAPIF